MPHNAETQPGAATAGSPRRSPARGERQAGLLAGMRIRKKLIFLHTCFSLVLAGILGLALRPAVSEVVQRAEIQNAKGVIWSVLARGVEAPVPGAETAAPNGAAAVTRGSPPHVEFRRGSAEALGLHPSIMAEAKVVPRQPVVVRTPSEAAKVIAYDDASGDFLVASVTLDEARGAVLRVYGLLILALLAVYGLVAAALEMFVLPQHVYGPIRRLLEADAAVREGDTGAELIPDSEMPADEIGEIMRSRNASIRSLRRSQRDLAEAAKQIELVATDLKRKNHLLEMAKQNLADADRLASLGMMSAGLSHEMNTPLAVLKGLVEKLARGTPGVRSPGASGTGGSAGVSQEEAELMLRVVGRLEKLSESLLDFARVRPPSTQPNDLASLVDEAWTLVSLDREARGVNFENRVRPSLTVECDGDRIVQVLVNLLRNAVDALDGGMRVTGPSAARNGHRVDSVNSSEGEPAGGAGRLVVAAETAEREGRGWVTLTITDNGPGIDPEVLQRLFEPFVSTRLDSRGTGLGLAVAEGIVREHGGLILARNREDGAGAVFEIMLPTRAPVPTRAHDAPSPIVEGDLRAGGDLGGDMPDARGRANGGAGMR